MITDPRFAPKRTDLPWLRRRRLPRSTAAPQPAAAPGSSDGSAQLRDFLAGRSTARPQRPTRQPTRQPAPSPRPPATPPTAPPAAPPPAARPAASTSLDLDAPTPPAPAGPPTPSSSLDLDEPTASPGSPTPSSSLDLDEPTPPARPTPAPSREPSRRRRVDRRVRPEDRIILTPTDPTVTLTPLQSGIGALSVEAAASGDVGDLRLGAAYELGTDREVTLQMTMQMTQGNRFAPPHSKRPVLVGSHERFERVSLDLRQVRSLRRLIVYAFSEKRQPMRWGGTLLATTFGGGRIEVPLESLQGGQVAVLLSIYQVRGELVLRAEMQTLNGDVREAARAYGYDKITWLDDRTPVE